MKVKELIKQPEQKGWHLDRIRGSHYVYSYEKAKRTIVVPVHGKEIPDFYAKAIIKAADKSIKQG